MRERVQGEEAVAKEKAEIAKTISQECEQDLEQAMPLLRSALRALATLNPQDINEVRVLRNPPAGQLSFLFFTFLFFFSLHYMESLLVIHDIKMHPLIKVEREKKNSCIESIGVKLVMHAVCVMLNIKPVKIRDPSGGTKKIDDWWGPSVELLADKNFLTRLREYNKDNISASIMTTIRNDFLTNPDFTPEGARQSSVACEGICRWVIAMEAYDRIAKAIIFSFSFFVIYVFSCLFFMNACTYSF